MPAIYETSPIDIFSPGHNNPVYIDTHGIDNWWGTVTPQFVRSITNGLNADYAVTSNPNPGTANVGDILGVNAAVAGVEKYLQENQINYIVGIVGLVLISAAIFQVVKP